MSVLVKFHPWSCDGLGWLTFPSFFFLVGCKSLLRYIRFSCFIL